MSKAPYMPMYWGDFFADTMGLKFPAKGAYCLLLGVYWRRGKPLPNDDEFLATSLNLSVKKWKTLKPFLIPFFRQDGDVLIHDRVELELLRSCERTAKAKQSQSHRIYERNALHIHIQDQEEESKKVSSPKEASDVVVPLQPKRPRKLIEYSSEFECFWSAYPDRRNNSKQNAAYEWARLSFIEQQAATNSLTAFSTYCRKNQDYRVVHCERYLRDRRFESFDDPRPSNGFNGWAQV